MPAGDQPVTSHERLPLVHSHNVDFWTMGEGLIQQHQDKLISSMKNVCYCIFDVFIVTSFTCRMTEIFHIIDDVTQFFSIRRISLLTAKTSRVHPERGLPTLIISLEEDYAKEAGKKNHTGLCTLQTKLARV